MRATMELYGDAMEYPAIHAQVALGNEDLTVKVVTSLPEGASVLCGLRNLFSFRRWAIVEEACRCARSSACLPTRTPQLRGPAWTVPALLLWSVFQKHGSKTKLTVFSNEPCLVFTGWLWARPSHLSAVRALLSGRPEALLPGGLWNRCSDLHPGN